jgi:hypothetical protein
MERSLGCVKGQAGICCAFDNVNAHAVVTVDRKRAFQFVKLFAESGIDLVWDISIFIQNAYSDRLAARHFLDFGNKFIQQRRHFSVPIGNLKKPVRYTDVAFYLIILVFISGIVDGVRLAVSRGLHCRYLLSF